MLETRQYNAHLLPPMTSGKCVRHCCALCCALSCTGPCLGVLYALSCSRLLRCIAMFSRGRADRPSLPADAIFNKAHMLRTCWARRPVHSANTDTAQSDTHSQLRHAAALLPREPRCRQVDELAQTTDTSTTR